ncbi:MAG: Holliday junction resolvase RuvX [Alcaligenaceae bacterium]|nr:Holliday junction resolvase RuvX [Alcaligenaceae bacterium]
MTEHTILCFDVGQKKIGVAIGNTITRQARPLEIIYGEAKNIRFAAVEKLIKEWSPDYAVIGLALLEDGSEQPSSRMARRFANQLEGRFGLKSIFQDETGSSMEAQSLLGNHDEDDAMAACVILQRYFDGLG